MKRQLWIGGRWREPQNYYSLFSPYTKNLIAEIPSALEDEVEAALSAAYEARSRMRNMPAHARAGILENLVALLRENEQYAAELISLEAAKPMKAARAEVERTIQTYKLAAEEAKRIHGETIPLDAVPGGEHRVAYTVKEPLGVIGAITPFNFPMNLVAHKIGPAIAAGNTVVLKPASQTPLSAYYIAELLHQAGLPDGALNVITGSGRTVGDQIVTDERVKMVTFTGSPAVGKEIRNKAGLKRVTLELGSNSAVIIDKDAALDKIIPRCIQGAFSYQGQMCISLQRIYVHDESYDAFVRDFTEAVSKLICGDPLDESVDVSALITEGDSARVLRWIEEAVAAGAAVACGGEMAGRVLKPTVILDAQPSLNVSCQEAFAPIVLINRISSFEEGIKLVNDSRFGLQAGVYTNDIGLALSAADQLQVGGVMINDIPTFRVDHMPYGGVKDSGIGREGVKYAVEEMTELKLVVFNRA